MRLLDQLHGRRFVLVDGPAGSGKSTLAATLEAPVVHMDDLYEGWTGQAAGIAQAQALVDALVEDRSAGYRRFDWYQGAYDEWVPVEPTPLLVIEGCFSGSVRADALLVWVEAPRDVRLARGLARDGQSFRDHWLRWQEDEDVIYARDRTRERAELRCGSEGPLL